MTPREATNIAACPRAFAVATQHKPRNPGRAARESIARPAAELRPKSGSFFIDVARAALGRPATAMIVG
ncbi:MAG TPA: hypothetical protein VEK07_11845, partial [Polyangiaceae bacterium]|nr:hypothetical protein [Polyangiaceae bacterium]